MSSDPNATQGQRELTTGQTPGNAMSFMMERALSKVFTALPVKVLAVDAPHFVTVQPLVNQLDGQGQALPQAPIYQVPYSRIQGGANALIIDPKAGDIGWCVFAMRDISTVKSSKAQANPASYRMHDAADAMYLGGILNGVPVRWIEISDTGIHIEGNVTVTGSITSTGDMVAAGISLDTHHHTGVEPGGGNTGGPA